MGALHLVEGKASLDADRCIGCGLCVSTCPTHALELARKPAAELPSVPRSFEQAMLRLGRTRGILGPRRLVGMATQSGVDRLLASR
jgi:ferredoxin